MTSDLPPNVIVRSILVTDLSQQLKKQREFLKWMGRRYSSTNKDQSEAFITGARLIDEIRTELLQGLFDAPATAAGVQEAGQVKELFTPEEEPAPGDEIVERYLAAVLEDRSLEEEALKVAEAIQLRRAVERNEAARQERLKHRGEPGYTYDGYVKCPDAFCDKAKGHEGYCE